MKQEAARDDQETQLPEFLFSVHNPKKLLLLSPFHR